MLEIFASWEWWQIALMAVFGTVWIVFIILDQRRKVAAKKLKARRKHFYDEAFKELKEHGYSDKEVKEMLQSPDFFIAYTPIDKDDSK